jgi:hypothetical protein
VRRDGSRAVVDEEKFRGARGREPGFDGGEATWSGFYFAEIARGEDEVEPGSWGRDRG